MDSLLNIPVILCATLTTLGYIMLTSDDKQIQEGGSLAYEYNDSNFKKVLAKAESEKKMLFIKLYAPWCGFCKELAPTWNELRQEIKKNSDLKDKVEIIQINADSQKYARKFFGVETFPTIVLFDGKKKKFYKYKGERDVTSFTSFINEYL